MTRLFLALTATVFSSAVLLAQVSPSPLDVQPGWSGSSTGYKYTPEVQVGPVLSKPLSATEVRRSTQTLSNGTHVDSTEKDRFYRDARGRMRLESTNLILIFDPVANFVWKMDPHKKSYSKSVGFEDGATAYIGVANSVPFVAVNGGGGRVTVSRAGSQSTQEDLGPAMINGIYARGSRVISTIPVGAFGNDQELQVINERWYSDDLQMLIKSLNSDPRFGMTSYELTDIVHAPPDPALFQLPADWVEK